MIRFPKKYSVDEVLLDVVFSSEHEDGRSFRKKIVFDGHRINMASQRLQLFATKGHACVVCGLVGSFFVKEKDETALAFHLNLYGVNEAGEEILFTKDHVVPRKHGGPDVLGNYQTMCCRCNEAKGATYEP